MKTILVLIGLFCSCCLLHAALTDGLMAYYQFNGNLLDSSGNGNNGTLQGSISYSTGMLDSGAYFNGSSYITVANSSSLTLNNQLTISAWVRVDAGSLNGASILQKGQSGTIWDYGLGTYSSYPSYRSSMSDWVIWENANRNDHYGAFYLLTVVVNETTDNRPHLYINGNELIGTLTTQGGGQTFDSDWIRQSSLGVRIGIGHPNEYFKGVIDDLRVYNRALSSTEISQLASMAVPEPGSELLLLAGLLAVRLLRQRR